METPIVTFEITKPYNEWVMHFEQSSKLTRHTAADVARYF